MKIGKAYRLPNGEKGICVDIVSEYGIFSYIGKHEQRSHEEYLHSEVTPWTEPRTWDDEVQIFENDKGHIKKFLASQGGFLDTSYKLVGRAKVVVKEGE